MFVRGGWCRGLLLEEKPELKRVLEQRRLELHREEEMAQRRPSDLETELRKRQQKLEEVRREIAAATKDISVDFCVKFSYCVYNPACPRCNTGINGSNISGEGKECWKNTTNTTTADILFGFVFRSACNVDGNSASENCDFLFFIFQYEQQEIRQRENQQKIPEFVRVKDNLRRTQTPEQ